MIYIFAALYAEVKPLIEALQLKKRMDSSHFQQFISRDGELLLTLTGVGMISAAAVVGAVLSQGVAGVTDLLLSVGSCAELHASFGSEIPDAKTYLLHKLINESTGRSFYPDIVLDAQIPEAACITGAKILESPASKLTPQKSCEDMEHYKQEALAGAGPLLYDMESAAIYEAGSIYLGPHQMHFLRFVTDTGTEQVSRQRLEARAGEAADVILPYITKLQEFMRMLQARQSIQTPEQEMEISRLGEELHCSAAMYHELRQYLKFAILSGLHWESVVDALRKTGKLPAGDRRAGKKVLNEIKHAILR